MAKKKICQWLNSTEYGSLVLRHGHVAACCTRELILLEKGTDFTKMSYEEIQNKRKELFEKMNSETSPCKNCCFMYEAEEENIDIGKLTFVVFHPHKTCNLKCSYCCYARSGEVLEKFDKEKYNIYQVISHLHDINILKDDFGIELGGGEPMLLEGIPESIEFLSKYYPKSTIQFISNFTLTNRIDKLIPVLINRKIKANLKTSVDCGTRKSYKKIRGFDLYNTMRNNILTAAKSNAFDDIILKYIFLDDCSNAGDNDINGFIKLVKEVKKANPNITSVVIDGDTTQFFKSKFTKTDMLPDKALKAACKIYRECSNIGCQFKWHGERVSYSSLSGRKQIEIILNSKNIQTLTLLQKIFSVKTENNHNVWRILGIKFSFRCK